jgi:hypothetical protein
MCQDAGISMTSWRRHFRDRLPVVQITSRHIGVRQSAWRQALGEGK